MSAESRKDWMMIAMVRMVDVQEVQRLNLVMLGPPGVGKGTQAERIAARLGIPHISSGDLFRTIIASGSPLGEELRGYVDRGEYVPDDVVVTVVKERLSAGDTAPGFIL